MAGGGFSLEVPAPLGDGQRHLAALLAALAPPPTSGSSQPGRLQGEGLVWERR